MQPERLSNSQPYINIRDNFASDGQRLWMLVKFCKECWWDSIVGSTAAHWSLDKGTNILRGVFFCFFFFAKITGEVNPVLFCVVLKVTHLAWTVCSVGNPSKTVFWGCFDFLLHIQWKLALTLMWVTTSKFWNIFFASLLILALKILCTRAMCIWVL